MQLWYVIIFLLLRFKTFVGKEKSRIFATSKAVIAQLVERQLPKLQVAGSRPVYRSILKQKKTANNCLFLFIGRKWDRYSL